MHISPSDKKYIGITSQKPERRWRGGKGYSHNLYFTRAIEKYGWGNFKHTILAEKLTEEEAMLMEITLIKEFRTNEIEYGYNICEGGGGTKGISLKGEKNGMYGKKHTDEWKEEHSKRMSGENNPNYKKATKTIVCSTCGKTFERQRTDFVNSNGTVKKHQYCSKECFNVHQRRLNSGENNPNYGKGKKVINLETGEIFDNATRASEKYDVTLQGILQAIKRESKCKGFHWKYLE